jgi:hypothetical protein
MAIEPLPETPSSCDETGSHEPIESGTPAAETPGELPGKLSDFSQRLASFGLGEAPDPLLTEARPPAKRRSRT